METVTVLFLLLVAVLIVILRVASAYDKKEKKSQRQAKKNDLLLSSTNKKVKTNRNYPTSSDSANSDSFKIAEDGTIIRIGAAKICPQCKKTFADEVKFCGECGSKLVKTAD